MIIELLFIPFNLLQNPFVQFIRLHCLRLPLTLNLIKMFKLFMMGDWNSNRKRERERQWWGGGGIMWMYVRSRKRSQFRIIWRFFVDWCRKKQKNPKWPRHKMKVEDTHKRQKRWDRKCMQFISDWSIFQFKPVAKNIFSFSNLTDRLLMVCTARSEICINCSLQTYSKCSHTQLQFAWNVCVCVLRYASFRSYYVTYAWKHAMSYVHLKTKWFVCLCDDFPFWRCKECGLRPHSNWSQKHWPKYTYNIWIFPYYCYWNASQFALPLFAPSILMICFCIELFNKSWSLNILCHTNWEPLLLWLIEPKQLNWHLLRAI